MNMMIWLIMGAEISFWLVLLFGLFVRYTLHKQRLSIIILALVPVIDLVLLTAAAVDIRSGAQAGLSHALAAVYIGVSAAFGKGLITTTDQWYRRIVLRDNVRRQKKYGLEYALHYVKGSIKHLAAYTIGCGILWLLILYAGNERTAVLSSFMRTWTVVLVIDFIIAGTYFIWPKKNRYLHEERMR